MSRPHRGEIWWADLEPTRGAEINKRRPVVVLSADGVGALPVKVVAPITGRLVDQPGQPWLVAVRSTPDNGLTRDGCVDVLQLRSIALQRFSGRIGALSPDDLDEVAVAVALVLELD